LEGNKRRVRLADSSDGDAFVNPLLYVKEASWKVTESGASRTACDAVDLLLCSPECRQLEFSGEMESEINESETFGVSG
jgi:hypothetical protein